MKIFNSGGTGNEKSKKEQKNPDKLNKPASLKKYQVLYKKLELLNLEKMNNLKADF